MSIARRKVGKNHTVVNGAWVKSVQPRFGRKLYNILYQPSQKKEASRPKAAKRKINPMNTRSNRELLQGHAITHKWWNDPKSTSWTRAQVRKEHDRLVRIMRKRGLNHNSPLR